MSGVVDLFKERVNDRFFLTQLCKEELSFTIKTNVRREIERSRWCLLWPRTGFPTFNDTLMTTGFAPAASV